MTGCKIFLFLGCFLGGSILYNHNGSVKRIKGVRIISEQGKTAALVKTAARGDKQAFVALIDSFRQTMYATAMAVARNEDDAMDAIQDTILILWEKLDTLRDPGAFKTWMTRILVNRCFGILRGKGKEFPVESMEEEAQSFDRDTSLDVQEALGRMPPEDRLVLQLFYFEDMPVREIARALSIKPEAVRMRLTRSRKRFKQQYETEVRYEK